MRTSDSFSHSREFSGERSEKGNKLDLTFSQYLSKLNVMSRNLKILIIKILKSITECVVVTSLN